MAGCSIGEMRKRRGAAAADTGPPTARVAPHPLDEGRRVAVRIACRPPRTTPHTTPHTRRQRLKRSAARRRQTRSSSGIGRRQTTVVYRFFNGRPRAVGARAGAGRASVRWRPAVAHSGERPSDRRGPCPPTSSTSAARRRASRTPRVPSEHSGERRDAGLGAGRAFGHDARDPPAMRRDHRAGRVAIHRPTARRQRRAPTAASLASHECPHPRDSEPARRRDRRPRPSRFRRLRGCRRQHLVQQEGHHDQAGPCWAPPTEDRGAQQWRAVPGRRHLHSAAHPEALACGLRGLQGHRVVERAPIARDGGSLRARLGRRAVAKRRLGRVFDDQFDPARRLFAFEQGRQRQRSRCRR